MKSRKWMKTNAIAFTIPAVVFMAVGMYAGLYGMFGMGFGIIATAWITYYDFVYGKDTGLKYEPGQSVKDKIKSLEDDRFREWVEKERARIDASKKI
jgi:hypothetical protein